MINFITRNLFGKELILYDRHRNTSPIADNIENKKDFIFWEIGYLWKAIPFKNSNKWKHKIMYMLLSILNPKYIMSMNWISKRESLYKVWTARNPKSKFIVVQHGGYLGGIVTDIAHKYTKCDVFLTWGEFYKDKFREFNSLKNVDIMSFGNTVYQKYNRDNYSYKKSNTNKVLILPTALSKENVQHLQVLIKKLKDLNFEVSLKEHSKQGGKEALNGKILYPSIDNVDKLSGDVYSILQKNDFNFIISDHSSSLLDSIFFKNMVIYFDPNNGKSYKTRYSDFLQNLFVQDFDTIKAKEFYSLINVEKQEMLLNDMVQLDNNLLKKLKY